MSEPRLDCYRCGIALTAVEMRDAELLWNNNICTECMRHLLKQRDAANKIKT